MITRLLAGAACAALLGLSVPASAATSPGASGSGGPSFAVRGAGRGRILREP